MRRPERTANNRIRGKQNRQRAVRLSPMLHASKTAARSAAGLARAEATDTIEEAVAILRATYRGPDRDGIGVRWGFVGREGRVKAVSK